MSYRHLCFLLCVLAAKALHAEPWWLESDYLLWTIKQAPLPVPLVTAASLNDPVPGALNQPGTEILIGDQGVDIGWQSGFRVALGGWIDYGEILGIEASFFMLPRKSIHQSVGTSGEPGSLNLAVPIFDVTGLWGLNGVPGETIFILPGPLGGPGFSGNFSLKMSSQLLNSELNTITYALGNYPFRIDCIGGLRWIQLQESLSFTGQTAALPGASVTGFYNFEDSFKTNNNFFGLQLGLQAKRMMHRYLLNAFAKAALGYMDQIIKIDGTSQTSNGNLFYKTQNTGNEVLPGGVFAEPTNIGSHHRGDFAVVLESGLNFTYLLSRSLEVGLSYNFLWANRLSRPGNQIDRKINPTKTVLAEASRESVGIGPYQPVPVGSPVAAPLPAGPNNPKFRHRTSDFWAQGFAVSLKLKF